jgi:hypothetical protein
MARKPKPLTKQANEAVSVAMRQLGTWLDQRFTEEISAVKWQYPTPPQVRDIVDTGRLRASQTRQETPEGVIFTWPVDYAQQVHDGGVSTRTRQPFPGRPWTKAPLEQAEEKFGEFLRNALESQK